MSVPDGLREALNEAARNVLVDFFGPVAPDDQLLHFLLNTQIIALSSWLVDHDAEVRQQGRNEERKQIESRMADGQWMKDEFERARARRALLPNYARPVVTRPYDARGGSDLKGQDDG